MAEVKKNRMTLEAFFHWSHMVTLENLFFFSNYHRVKEFKRLILQRKNHEDWRHNIQFIIITCLLRSR